MHAPEVYGTAPGSAAGVPWSRGIDQRRSTGRGRGTYHRVSAQKVAGERRVTLRWKTYVLVGTTLLVALLVVYAVSQTLFMRGFANVETRQMQD